MSKIVVFLVVAVTLCNLASAETSLKPYSPFDEPKPRIAKEIIEDKRLDVKVNVFVKSKNFRDLFSEISKQTGVKLTADRDIAAERAIIYFHARPLRDVMTELSGLFGYYWLPKGKPGAYSYELREDSRHAARRDQLKQARKETEDALLLELIKRSADGLDGEALKQLAKKDESMYQYVAGDYGRRMAKMLSGLGDDFLHRILKDGRTNLSFSDLSPQSQIAILDWRNVDLRADWERSHNERGPPFQSLTPEDMAGKSVRFNRLPAEVFDMPTVEFYMGSPYGSLTTSWPHLFMRESDYRSLTGQEPIPAKVKTSDLPDKPAITVRREPYLRLGDILKGIAEQSGRDVIADYYFQGVYFPPADKEPLNKVVERLCQSLDYSCQVDGSLLRFRLNRWFVVSPLDEPPARLIEAWSRKKATIGRLEFSDLRDMANLREKQLRWPGPDHEHERSLVAETPSAFHLLSSLSPDQEAQARTKEGLPASHLSRSQLDHLSAWADEVQVNPNAKWEGAVVKIVGKAFGFLLKDIHTDFITIPSYPVGKEGGQSSAALPKADLPADKVEVVK